MRPGDTWLTTSEPMAPRSVSNWVTTASSVSTLIDTDESPPRSNAGPRSPDLSGMAVMVCAESRVMRCPETNSARSHQWEPMSANARDGPPRPASTRQLLSSGASSQSWR